MLIPCAQPVTPGDDSDELAEWASKHPWSEVDSQLQGPEMPFASVSVRVWSAMATQSYSGYQGVHENGTVDPANLTLQRGPETPATIGVTDGGSTCVYSLPTASACAQSDAQADDQWFDVEMSAESPVQNFVHFDSDATSADTFIDSSLSSQISDTSSLPGVDTPDESDNASDSAFSNEQSPSTFPKISQHLDFPDFPLEYQVPMMYNGLFNLVALPQATTFHSPPVSTTDPTSPANSDEDPCPYEIIDSKYKCLHLKCRGKERLYDQPGELRKHQKNHRKPTKCNICGSGFAERKDVDRHKLKHHRDHPHVRADRRAQRQEVRCEVCGQRGRADNIRRHMVVHRRR
ncbi:hypothetical protein B0T21DRAFT_416103 [Apiosordaria backusii]|uniref:C2H2-type domain-containing protein n=1 Tax=Apiosordaria backusii TaxID=314023 RepID=A0AA40A7C8_9PEZI|nr:hypothetical protein B0T21DRAFT_416103 [Apiosordaria backusii]